MTSVNELRIGNKVKCKTSNDAGIYTVLALDGLHLKIYLNEPRNKWHTEDLIKPIELSEEILLKCGFVGGLGYSYSKNGITLIWNRDEKQFELNFSNGFMHSTVITIVFKTLHNLQNWWYDSFKTELEINL